MINPVTVCIGGGSTFSLFPLYGDFGRAQRAVAKRQGVHLVPKRYFARVLGAPGATDDGLHLSRHGAMLMADMVHELIQPVLQPRGGRR